MNMMCLLAHDNISIRLIYGSWKLWICYSGTWLFTIAFTTTSILKCPNYSIKYEEGLDFLNNTHLPIYLLKIVFYSNLISYLYVLGYTARLPYSSSNLFRYDVNANIWRTWAPTKVWYTIFRI